MREMTRLLNEQPGSGLANKPLWATETGIPLRETVPKSTYPLNATDGEQSTRWLRILDQKLEELPTFVNAEVGFYYLQDTSDLPDIFTTGLRNITDGRGKGDPRHTGCQLAKLWGGSGFILDGGGEWKAFRDGHTVYTNNCL